MPLSHNSVFEGFGCGGASGNVGQAGSLCQKRKIDFGSNGFDQDMDYGRERQQWPSMATEAKRQCLWPSEDLRCQNFSKQQQQQQLQVSEEPLPGCLKDTTPQPAPLPLQTTPELAASVGFSSAALTSSASVPNPYQSSPSIPSSCLLVNHQMNGISLASVFISRLQHRKRQEALQQASAQNLSEAVEMNVESESCKELNNNNSAALKDISTHPSNVPCNEEAMESCTTMDSDYVPDMTQYIPTPVTASSASFSSSSSLASGSLLPSLPTSTPQNIRIDDRSGLKPSPVSGRLHCLCSASWRGMYGMDVAYMTDYY